VKFRRFTHTLSGSAAFYILVTTLTCFYGRVRTFTCAPGDTVAYEEDMSVNVPVQAEATRKPGWAQRVAHASVLSLYDGGAGVSVHLNELQNFLLRTSQQLQPVLLLGEPGLRQEQLARALHRLSANWAEPFLAVNAHGLSETTLHTLLFGAAGHTGMLASARRGTIFVNELTRLSPVLQQRFAVYLEERLWQKHEPASQRLVLATDEHAVERTTGNRIAYGLIELLRPHSFRLKPLRERSEDIPALATHITQRLAQKLKMGAVELPEATLRVLAGYHWPHNLEELEAVLQASLAQLGTVRIGEDALPEKIRYAQLRTLPASGIDLTKRMEDYERNLLTTALRQTGNSQTKAAKLLGLRVQTLNMKLKRWAEQGRPLI
jgi:DNA-binding NtrC family response regulator